MNNDNREKITAYVTKHALTQGIVVVQAEVCSGNMISVQGRYTATFHGEDWHRDLPSAVARAKQMVERKIKSLDKQRQKLVAMRDKTWEPVT